MLKKGRKAYSILKNKCPKCNEGNFFEDDNPLRLKKVLKMSEHCTACGFKYQIEPSFFYGAMYVSYAITVALSIFTFVILYALGLELNQIFIGIIAALILFTPFTLRLARLVYINIFVGYDAAYRNEDGIKAAQIASEKSID
jgi:uncharacterized protein (DUF983 family)